MNTVAGCAAGLLLVMFATGTAHCAESRCNAGPHDAAAKNAVSLETLRWAPFRRPELGWATYAPLIAKEIGVSCPPDSPAFAQGLAAWQKKHHAPATGVMDPATFRTMEQNWELARPFVMASRHICPPPPDETTLVKAVPGESYGGKQIMLQRGALEAYRRLVMAARAELPTLSSDPLLLRIFSGYRGPDADDARCRRDNNCHGVVRAICSAHRTGMAMDLYLGAAPGSRPDSSDDSNRRYLTHTPVYLWLVRNASRFGFVNYPFEPWHWEWTGGTANKPQP